MTALCAHHSVVFETSPFELRSKYSLLWSNESFSLQCVVVGVVFPMLIVDVTGAWADHIFSPILEFSTRWSRSMSIKM